MGVLFHDLMPRPFWSALAVSLRSTLAGALVTALLDLVITTSRASQPVSGFALVRALEAAVGFYAAAGLFFGIAAGLVAGGMAATFPVGETLRRWRNGLRNDDGRDRAQAAGVLAGAAALGLVGAFTAAYALVLGQEMSNRRNGAVTTGMFAAVAVLLATLAWFPMYRAFRRVAPLVPRPRTLVVLGAIAALTLAGAAGALFSVDWRVIDFGPAEALLLFIALSVAHAAFWYRPRGQRLRERMSVRIRRLLTVGAIAAAALCLAVTWLRFGDEPRSLSLLAEESMGGKVLLRVARRLADHDKDGYAARLGGGDCNDHDAKVHPGAEEVRGNRVDEDCDGADAPVEIAHKNVEGPASAQAAAYTWKGNLLVITVDTLRADRLDAAHMPRTAALARDAVVFTHAYAQAPNTPRSFPSFLTSRFPSEVKWARLNMNFPTILDAPENTTFFQALHTAGLRTVGVFSHFYMKPENGIARGFDQWDNEGALTLHDSNTDIAAPRIVPRVVAQLKALKKSGLRFALWTHLFEPHSKYVEHDGYPIKASGLKGLEEKYDAEVAFTDKHLGLIFDALEESGLAQDTAVVIFSDHGEAFGEHRFGGERMYFHGQTLYDELLRVPLVIKVPGVKPRAVPERVMLVDLGPTLCDLFKAARPKNFHGRSLLPALLGEPLPVHPVYAELLPTPSWNHLWRSIIEGELKLIHKLSENTLELYDLGKDPTEQKNLSGSDDREAGLKKTLRTFMTAEGFPG
jgi:arylsulfatase A-like enzyme